MQALLNVVLCFDRLFSAEVESDRSSDMKETIMMMNTAEEFS
jgi:hypothetical protein